MLDFFEALRVNPLLLTAIIAGIGSSIVSSIIGAYVVVKRIVFISGSIAHAVLSGIGFFLWLKYRHGFLWADPFYGAVIAAVLSALILGLVRRRYKGREDCIIAALWAVGMAIGVIFISSTPGLNTDLMDYLIGNILWVSHSDLLHLLLLDVIVVSIAFIFHKRFLILCFDEEQAKLQGVSVNALYTLLLVCIALSIVLLVQIVGIVLVMTMLTVPSAIANLYTERLSRMMFVAMGLSISFYLIGILSAYYLDWPPGATVALLAGCSYGLTLVFKN